MTENYENDNHFDENQSDNSLKGNKKNIFIKIIDWCKRSFLQPIYAVYKHTLLVKIKKFFMFFLCINILCSSNFTKASEINNKTINLNGKNISVKMINNTVKSRYYPFLLELNNDEYFLSSGQNLEHNYNGLLTGGLPHQNSSEIYSLKKNTSKLITDSTYVNGIVVPNNKVLLLGKKLDILDLNNNYQISTFIDNSHLYIGKFGTKINSLAYGRPIYFFLKNNHSVYCVYTSYLTEIDLKTKEVKGITQFYGGSNYHLLNEQELFYCGIDAFDTQIRGTNYFIYNIDKNQIKRISKNNNEINKLNSLDVKNKIICCGFISENNIIKIKIDIIDKNKQSIENTLIKNNIFNKEQKIEIFEFENNIYFFQDGIIKMSLNLNNNQIKNQTIKIFDDKNVFVSLKNNELILYTNK